MIALIIFLCGGLGVLAAARKNMISSLTGLFCQSVAVYAALLSSGSLAELLPEIPFSFGETIRKGGSLLVCYVLFLIVISKLSTAILEEKTGSLTEIPVSATADKVFSKTGGFLTGCVAAHILIILLAWIAFSFKLPVIGEKEFRNSARAHVTFFTGTMNVFTWSTSYAALQKKQILKLFPSDAPKVVRNDRLSSMSEADKKALIRKKSILKKSKKKKKIRKIRKKNQIKQEGKQTDQEKRVPKEKKEVTVFFLKGEMVPVCCVSRKDILGFSCHNRGSFPEERAAS